MHQRIIILLPFQSNACALLLQNTPARRTRVFSSTPVASNTGLRQRVSAPQDSEVGDDFEFVDASDARE